MNTEPATTATAAPDRLDQPVPRGPGRVLVIHDDDATRYILVRTLQEAGYDTVEAQTGEDGLRLLQAGTPDVVVLDVGLPGISGFEVCRRIRKNPATTGVPVIQVSAEFTNDTNRVEALEGGANVFLRTPVNPAELLAQVRALLRLREAELQGARSEQRYRILFESLDDGLCIIQMIFDESGRPLDYLFLEMNATGEKHTGLHNPAGKTARQLVPDLDDFWFETYGKVARTGRPVRCENHAPAMQRWFEVYAFPFEPGSGKAALRFKDRPRSNCARPATNWPGSTPNSRNAFRNARQNSATPSPNWNISPTPSPTTCARR